MRKLKRDGLIVLFADSHTYQRSSALVDDLLGVEVVNGKHALAYPRDASCALLAQNGQKVGGRLRHNGREQIASTVNSADECCAGCVLAKLSADLSH